MSIIGHLALVTQDDITALHRDPSSIFDVLNTTRDQHPARILEYAQNVESIFAFHYAFSGQLAAEAQTADSPLAFLIGGGWEVDDIEVGYGPARAFDSKQLSAIVGAVDNLDTEEASQRLLDPRASGPEPEVRLPPGMPAGAQFTLTPEQIEMWTTHLRAMLGQIIEFLRSGSAEGMALLVYAS